MEDSQDSLGTTDTESLSSEWDVMSEEPWSDMQDATSPETLTDTSRSEQSSSGSEEESDITRGRTLPRSPPGLTRTESLYGRSPLDVLGRKRV